MTRKKKSPAIAKTTEPKAPKAVKPKPSAGKANILKLVRSMNVGTE